MNTPRKKIPSLQTLTWRGIEPQSSGPQTNMPCHATSLDYLIVIALSGVAFVFSVWGEKLVSVLGLDRSLAVVPEVGVETLQLWQEFAIANWN